MESDMYVKSVLRTFKAIPIASSKDCPYATEIMTLNKEKAESINKGTVNHGFIFSNEVIANYNIAYLKILSNIVKEELMLSGEEINSSFHKSWEKIKNTPEFILYIEQIFHYLTTYGYESIYGKSPDSSDIFIPHEALDIPEINEDIVLTIIKGYKKEEIKKKLMNILKSGIALKEETIDDIIIIANNVDVELDDINLIKNKEVRLRMFDKFNIIPDIPVEILRLLVFRCTEKTLLIKDKDTIDSIKNKIMQSKGDEYIEILENKSQKLSEIFYRYKPIFLAFRSNRKLRPYINKIRKLACDNHKPMEDDYLNKITSMLKNGEEINIDRLITELSNVNIFRKNRLAYALRYRLKDVDSIVYKIRNGKGYATSFDFCKSKELELVYDIVIQSIVDDIKPKVYGKKIYIPYYVNYALPITEKMFSGNLPNGTSITTDENMIVGVHWYNQPYNQSYDKRDYHHRIDLDLSALNINMGKIGWNSSFYDEDKNLIYSGDMTDASLPKGASELFYISSKKNTNAIVELNYFNYNQNIPVPFKIMVAKVDKKPNNFSRNYMVDPNDLLCVVNTKIDKKQKILGLIVSDGNKCTFYFSEIYMGNSIVSSCNKNSEFSRKYLVNFYKNSISLNKLIAMAGGEIVSSNEGVDIDLSLESIDKDKIINLLVG